MERRKAKQNTPHITRLLIEKKQVKQGGETLSPIVDGKNVESFERKKNYFAREWLTQSTDDRCNA